MPRIVTRPVIALDIDGTLGDYHGWFTMFAEMWTGRSMPSPSAINPALPFHRHLGMSKAYYRQCKLAYRQGGLERSMPVYPGAREMVRSFRKAGAAVWLCTTRPYLRMDNSDVNTRHWLRRNGIQYDGLLYGPHKYRELVRQVGKSHILAVLDDLAEMLYQAETLGIVGYIRDQPYNRYTDDYPRVHDFLTDSWRMDMLGLVRKWYDQ